MLPVRVLIESKKLIEDREKWTQFHYARDEDQEPTEPGSTDACQWCAAGAIRAITHNHQEREDATYILASTISDIDGGNLDPECYNESISIVSDFNDAPDTNHEAILDAFDLAILDAPYHRRKQ